MMQKIQGEAPFQVLASNFSIGPTASGYTLQISADGVNYSNLFSVGADVTRLVTNVANGSYYRLSGNVGEAVINWRTQCNDGGSGGGSGSTVAVNQILSAGTEIAQISVDGVPTSLYAPEGGEGEVSFNLDAMTQQERADFVAYMTGLTEDERVKTVIYKNNARCVYAYIDSGKVGLRVSKEDGWSVPVMQYQFFFVKPDGDFEYQGDGKFANVISFYTDIADTAHTLTQPDNISPLNIVGGLDGGDARLALNVKLITSDSPYLAVLSTTCSAERDDTYGGYLRATFDYSGQTISAEWRIWENSATNTKWEVNQGGSAADALVHLETLSGVSGETNVLYECDGELFWWNENAGCAAEWNQIPPTGTTAFGGKYFGMSFAQIPEGTILLEYYWTSTPSEKTRIIYEDGKIVAKYSTDNYTAVQASAATGESMMAYVPNAQVTSYRVYFKLDSHNFGFYSNSGLLRASTYWDGEIGEGHWEIVGREPYPYVPTDKVIIPNYDERGMPASEWAGGLTVGETFVNFTGATSTYRADIIYRGTTHLPPRIFVPTSAGTEGQVLISTGGSAPVWATMIKAVQITSADYEALATKDPNTLYLIVDE